MLRRQQHIGPSPYATAALDTRERRRLRRRRPWPVTVLLQLPENLGELLFYLFSLQLLSRPVVVLGKQRQLQPKFLATAALDPRERRRLRRRRLRPVTVLLQLPENLGELLFYLFSLQLLSLPVVVLGTQRQLQPKFLEPGPMTGKLSFALLRLVPGQWKRLLEQSAILASNVLLFASHGPYRGT